MTLGEKLTKLRKDANYTQESLGEILNVSRQSVSKWETDLAFPETQKLIEIAKLFGCSIDYLLDHEIQKETPAELKKTNPPLTQQQFTGVWGISYFVLMLILYTLPIINMVYEPTIPSFPDFAPNMTISVNTYSLLRNGPTQIGNIIIYLAFIALIGILITSILISTQKENKNLYKIRLICAYTEIFFWFLFLILFISNITFTIIFIILVTIANTICLHKLSKHKYMHQSKVHSD